MKQDEIIRMAREAGAWPELSTTPEKDVEFLRRFAALVAAAAQPEQEPVILADKALKRIFLEVNRLAMTTYTAEGNQMICIEPSLYKQLREAIEALAQPEQERPWVGLTFEERNGIWRKEIGWGDPSHNDEDLMKAIEAKLKDKNNG